ncbi:MAG: hypothetical protein AMXMBFR20_33450 [Planctomycetia bacterium]
MGRLSYEGGLYRFLYTRGAQTLPGFQPFPGMADLNTVYESEELLPIFSNRLLSKSRPEYEAYLTWSGFDPESLPDPLAILGVTEGRRQTDSLEVFPCPMPDAEGCYLTKFFLHGLRYMPQAAIDRVSMLRSNTDLALMLDISNTHDPYAVAVRTADIHERFMIGYVPRYLARDIGLLSLSCDPDFLHLTVERLNPSAPLQMRLLCRMRACWPENFRPCAGEEYQPIASEQPSVAT